MSNLSLPVILAFVFYLLSWLIPLTMLFLVPVRRKPSSATAWLMLIFLFPFLGLLLYLLLGIPKLSQRRLEQQRKLTEGLARTTSGLQQRPDLGAAYKPPILVCYEPFAKLAQNLTGLPAFGGNSVELLPDYVDAFQRIAADIDQAQKFVHIEYYCFARSAQTEPVFLAMERAVARGVSVRALYDQLGSMPLPGFKPMLKRMSEVGIEHHPILPLRFFSKEYTRPDLRNHRKLVIVDGTVGYIGSQNLV
jgi:cardiolipin synthase